MSMKAGNMKSGWKLWRNKNRSKPSQTEGKVKNEWCQTDGTKKFFATSTKAYKHKQYDHWHGKFKRANIGGT